MTPAVPSGKLTHTPWRGILEYLKQPAALLQRVARAVSANSKARP